VLLRNGINGRRPYSNKIAIKNPATGSLARSAIAGLLLQARAVCATHNLSLPKAFAGTGLPIFACLRIIVSQSLGRKSGKGRYAMGVAIEISFALWIMIGCFALEAIQLMQYLD
jgi:hypothetical protein